MEFWIASVGLGVAVAALLVMAVLRGRAPDEPLRHDLQVYRDQLAEIDRDAARGTVANDEAGRLRNEVRRRILEADRSGRGAGGGMQVRDAPGLEPGRIAAAVVVVALVAGSYAVYLRIGAPGYPDRPIAARIAEAETARATRPSQAAAERAAAARQAGAPPAARPGPQPGVTDLIDRLRTALADRPDDLQGHMLLARHETLLGNYGAARAAQERVIAIRGAAVEARDLAGLADLMILAADGYVSPEAEAVLNRVLEIDPVNGTARYYAGLLEVQTGRPDRAFRIWRALLEQSQPEAPWVAPIRARIGDLARLAGVRYTPPPEGAAPLRGPDAATIADAGEMSVTERLEMIRGMVGSLTARLSEDGGTPDEWAQLIRAHGVLGETTQAAAVWSAARNVFSDDPGALDRVRRAAQDAGVSN